MSTPPDPAGLSFRSPARYNPKMRLPNLDPIHTGVPSRLFQIFVITLLALAVASCLRDCFQ